MINFTEWEDKEENNFIWHFNIFWVMVGKTTYAINIVTDMFHKYRIRNLGSSHQRCSIKKGILRNFNKFTGKQLCQSAFLNEAAGLSRTTLIKNIKKDTLAQVLSCVYYQISKNTFFAEHLWTTASWVSRCSCKNGVLDSFVISTRKRLCWVLLLKK